MWRALFLALGITFILSGTQLFFVEQLEVTRIRRPAAAAANGPYANGPFQQASWQNSPGTPAPKTFLFTPRDWMPWSLVAVGIIVVIYTFTIPARRYSTAED